MTGPWTLGVGLGVYVIGKEFYVINSETVIIGVMGGVIYWLMNKIGKPVGEFLDTRSQVMYPPCCPVLISPLTEYS